MSLKLDNKITILEIPNALLLLLCVSVYVCQKIIFSDSHPYTEEQIYVYVCLIRKEYKDDSHNKLNYLHVT